MNLLLRVNEELVLDAGTCEEGSGPAGPELLIRPPETTLFRQVGTSPVFIRDSSLPWARASSIERAHLYRKAQVSVIPPSKSSSRSRRTSLTKR